MAKPSKSGPGKAARHEGQSRIDRVAPGIYRCMEEVRGVTDDGAVLVRPDHFVAWGCKSIVNAGANKLVEVFDTVLPKLE